MADFRFRIRSDDSDLKKTEAAFRRTGTTGEKEMRKVQRGADRVDKEFKDVAQNVNVVGGRLQRLGQIGNVFTGIVQAGNAIVGIFRSLNQQVSRFLSSILDAGFAFEGFATSVATLQTQNLTEAENIFDRLLEISTRLPVPLSQIQEAYRDIFALGLADNTETALAVLEDALGASVATGRRVSTFLSAAVSQASITLQRLGIRVTRDGNIAELLLPTGETLRVQNDFESIRDAILQAFSAYRPALAFAAQDISTLRQQIVNIGEVIRVGIFRAITPQLREIATGFREWALANQEVIASRVGEYLSGVAQSLSNIGPDIERAIPVFASFLETVGKITVGFVVMGETVVGVTKFIEEGWTRLLDIFREVYDALAAFGAIRFDGIIPNFSGVVPEFQRRQDVRARSGVVPELAFQLPEVEVVGQRLGKATAEAIEEEFEKPTNRLAQSIGQAAGFGLEKVLTDFLTGERGLLGTFREGGTIIADYIRGGFARGVASIIGEEFRGFITDSFTGLFQNIRQSLTQDGGLGGLPGGLGGVFGGIGGRVRGFVNSPLGQAAGGALAGGLTLFSGIQEGSALNSAIGGAGLGASIGSIVPGIGTIVGGVIGGIVGGIVGFFRRKKKPSIEVQSEIDNVAQLLSAQLDTGLAEGLVSVSTRRVDTDSGTIRTAILDVATQQVEAIRDAIDTVPAQFRAQILEAFNNVQFDESLFDFRARGNDVGERFESFLRALPGQITAEFEPVFEAYFTALGANTDTVQRLVTDQLATLRTLEGEAAQARGEEFVEQMQLYARAFELARQTEGADRAAEDLEALSQALGFELVPSIETAKLALTELIQTGQLTERTVNDFEDLLGVLEQQRDLARQLTEQADAIGRSATGVVGMMENLQRLSGQLGFEFVPTLEGARDALNQMATAGQLTEEAARGFEQLIRTLQELPALLGRTITSVAQEIARGQEILRRSNFDVVGTLTNNINSLERTLDGLSLDDLDGQQTILNEIGSALNNIIAIEQQEAQEARQIRLDALRDEREAIQRVTQERLEALNEEREAIRDSFSGRIEALNEERDQFNKLINSRLDALREERDLIRESTEERIELATQERDEFKELSTERLNQLSEELSLVNAINAAQDQAAGILQDIRTADFSPLSGGARIAVIQDEIQGLSSQLRNATGFEATEISTELSRLYQLLLRQASSVLGAGTPGFAQIFNQVETGLEQLARLGGEQAERAEDLEKQILETEQMQLEVLQAFEEEIKGLRAQQEVELEAIETEQKILREQQEVQLNAINEEQQALRAQQEVQLEAIELEQKALREQQESQLAGIDARENAILEAAKEDIDISRTTQAILERYLSRQNTLLERLIDVQSQATSATTPVIQQQTTGETYTPEPETDTEPLTPVPAIDPRRIRYDPWGGIYYV